MPCEENSPVTLHRYRSHTCGALRAAVWLPGRAPALYGMGDVLGLHPGSPA